jgi:hypothetical protein
VVRGIRTEANPHVGSNRFISGLRSARLTLALLLVGARAGDETKSRDIALSQSALPLLFYVLIALALPLRHADLVIVLLSWYSW